MDDTSSTEESVKLRRDSATKACLLVFVDHHLFVISGAIYPEFHGFFLLSTRLLMQLSPRKNISLSFLFSFFVLFFRFLFYA
jgi:hypothetical protein